jgi:hypothetical protein
MVPAGSVELVMFVAAKIVDVNARVAVNGVPAVLSVTVTVNE